MQTIMMTIMYQILISAEGTRTWLNWSRMALMLLVRSLASFNQASVFAEFIDLSMEKERRGFESEVVVCLIYFLWSLIYNFPCLFG